MKRIYATASAVSFILILMTSCGGADNTDCYLVCDDQVALECSDIEQTTCYNLCDAYAQRSTECAEASAALSACQLEQEWMCTEAGPSLTAPLACEDRETIRLTFCIDPPTTETSSEG